MDLIAPGFEPGALDTDGKTEDGDAQLGGLPPELRCRGRIGAAVRYKYDIGLQMGPRVSPDDLQPALERDSDLGSATAAYKGRRSRTDVISWGNLLTESRPDDRGGR